MESNKDKYTYNLTVQKIFLGKTENPEAIKGKKLKLKSLKALCFRKATLVASMGEAWVEDASLEVRSPGGRK